MAITGADASTAQQYLEITAWNMEEALNLFMESGGSGGASSQAGATSTTGFGDQEVRAPDPSKRQRLVGGDGFDSPRVYPAPQFFNRPVNVSHYNDFTSSALNPNGLLHQDFVQDSIALLNQQMNSSRQNDDGERSTRRDPQNLSQLFQPPTRLMFHGTFARRSAKDQKKWLLVNIQDETIFASLMLNRDTWSDDLVQNLVESSFIFWQSPINNEHGKKFCTLYQIEADLLPIVCILDPRTGQKLVEWYNFMEPSQMTEKLSDFCCLNSMDGAPIMPPRPASAPPQKSLVDASEEEQLAAAIAASLQQDDDSDMEDCVEIEEKPVVVPPPAPVPVVLEPLPEEPSDGPMVTRIQIRTTSGTRLMRRFHKADPVSLLFRFVQHEIPEAQSRDFELRTSYPPKAIDAQAPMTLSDAKLENASLMMQWK
ncbi:hypothetical protein THRCLA_03697 [Thraustotheca clavata]|uniref:UBX domain-containing protein n=1 Tax=Thraustotheca clavata TaxID=74557 RepID=A0A1W0A165_9STRA|nr:hypothetical protein THRCLA_03697 [Thraustotheca clavata]